MKKAQIEAFESFLINLFFHFDLMIVKGCQMKVKVHKYIENNYLRHFLYLDMFELEYIFEK